MADDRSISALILQSSSPTEAKTLGNSVAISRGKWDLISECVMRNILFSKFSQNPSALSELISTGDKVLVEANPNDKIWGVGMSVEQVMRLGPDFIFPPNSNRLGRVLMSLRSHFDHSDLFCPTLIVSDSICRHLPLSKDYLVISWGGAKIAQVFTLAFLTVGSFVQQVFIQGGTNDLPVSSPFDPVQRYDTDGTLLRRAPKQIFKAFHSGTTRLHNYFPLLDVTLMDLLPPLLATSAVYNWGYPN